jgi:CBS domain-containing protein
MKIKSLIDRNYYSVSVLEDMQEIGKWLQEREYYAVIDEEDRTIGIVTEKDFIAYPQHQLINCCVSKPHLSPGATIIEAYDLMKEHKYTALPVFDGDEFVGVINLWALTERLLELLDNYQQDEHSMFGTSV